MLAPTPAHVKSSSRRPHDASRGGSREHVSVQPLAPQSRRQSQQHGSRAERDSGLVAPHPYAAPGSTGGYRGAYGQASPQTANGAPTNGSGPLVQHPNNSGSFMYGQGPGKAGTASREGTTTAGTRQDGMNGTQTRGMAMYDQMARVGEQDEHGLGRKKGFWAAFCCRA